jgi:hypothetical protein
MGVFTCADTSTEAQIAAVRLAHPKLAEFDIFIDKSERR